jgi:flagellar protein FliT
MIAMANARNPRAQSALLGYYEKIGRVSQLMVEAAQNGDWTTLADAEAVCEQLIRRARSVGEPAATLDAEGRKRRLEILRAILADDARIRQITEPWAAQVAPYVGPRARRMKRV